MFDEILCWIKVIVRPSYWLMNEKFSLAWDTKIRELMQVHEFVYGSKATATLGSYLIWIENHPYASFKPYAHFSDTPECRPSRVTIMLARAKLLREVGSQKVKKPSIDYEVSRFIEKTELVEKGLAQNE